MGGAEIKYVSEVFDSNWIAPVGPYIDKFENGLSLISNNYHFAALSSGTAAIHLALILLNIKSGDNVICSSFTFAASANPIKYLGANPIFIDSEEQTWNMWPKLLELAIIDSIEKGTIPKAIILVPLYGMPAKINEIITIADKYSIPVIEDVAEALGSKYDGIPLGTFGKFGIYSFNGNKIITASTGGALFSNDKKIIDKAKKLATQAREEAAHYEHIDIGYNYRLSNICAAIGFGQLQYLTKRINKKRYIFNFYKNSLSEIDDIIFLDENDNIFSNFWLTTILLKKGSIIDREYLRLSLSKSNIETRPLWKPMHLQPVFKDSCAYVNGVSEDLFNRGLCLPSDTNMKDEDLNVVVNKIKEIYAT